MFSLPSVNRWVIRDESYRIRRKRNSTGSIGSDEMPAVRIN
jgi:hypothetical protein